MAFLLPNFTFLEISQKLLTNPQDLRDAIKPPYYPYLSYP